MAPLELPTVAIKTYLKKKTIKLLKSGRKRKIWCVWVSDWAPPSVFWLCRFFSRSPPGHKLIELWCHCCRPAPFVEVWELSCKLQELHVTFGFVDLCFNLKCVCSCSVFLYVSAEKRCLPIKEWQLGFWRITSFNASLHPCIKCGLQPCSFDLLCLCSGSAVKSTWM